jgi:hypothetical protein
MSERMPRCRGLLGLIFGHKFVMTLGEWPRDYCLRCGMRRQEPGE